MDTHLVRVEAGNQSVGGENVESICGDGTKSCVLLIDQNTGEFPLVPIEDSPLLAISCLGARGGESLIQRLREVSNGHISYIDVDGVGRSPDTVQKHADSFDSVNAADLTGLSIKISEFINKHAYTATNPFVCVHGLGVLFNYTDTEFVYKFLHQMLGKMRTVHSTVLLFLDSDVVSKRQHAVVKSLVDERAE